jgi:nitrogen regulatory protein PII
MRCIGLVLYSRECMSMMIRCVMAAENLPAFVEGMLNLAAGMTVWETREHSPQTSQIVSYRGVPYEVGGLSVNVDIVSDDSWVEDIIRRIREASVREEFTVRHVFVFPVEASYHIRNGFMDI